MISRDEARAQGRTTYFTGEPCRHGHVSERRVDEGKCVACINERAARRRAKNPERVREVATACRARNRDRVLTGKRVHYAQNREAILAAARARYAADPERREQVKQSRALWTAANQDRKRASDRNWVVSNRARHQANGRQWRQENVDRARECDRARYAKNPDRWRESAKRWLANNPEKIAEYNSARRARKQGAEGRYTADDVARIFAMQKGRCACCGKRRPLTVDHIVPLSRGGTNWPSNLQGACHSCNSRKNARDPIEFMQSMGALL